MARQFKPGNKFGRGGAKPGAGRTPEWLKTKCRDIVDKEKLIEFLGDVASGKNVETKTVFNADDMPVKVQVPAEVKDRIKATQELLDRGWGKATQTLANDPDNPLPSQIVILPSQDMGKPGKMIISEG